VCVECEYIVYLDPKIAVGTIIRNDADQIALVRRSIQPGYGKWVFPGGYVDRGEDLLTAAAREAKEEANLHIRIEGLINLYSYAGRTPIIVVYAASVVGGELRADDESLEAGWFEESQLPWPELAFQSTHDALRDHLRGVLHVHI
jgi:ADP-ribose pyrophosphatase YjhB (NUDIX family)